MNGILEEVRLMLHALWARRWLGLAVAWGGAALARAAPSKRFTYGLKGSTILAALANALLLLVAIGATRFALRREEAARVIVKREVAHG